MKISIVTPSYNQVSYLQEALRSVKDQQSIANVEHIVIDGGSLDGSVEVIREHSSSLSYWHSERDSGQSSAISAGFTRATGDILSWVNSDDGLAPGASSAMLNALAEAPHPAWAIGQCHVIDSTGNHIGTWVPQPNLALDDIVIWSKNYIMQPAVFWNRPMHDVAFSLRESLHYAMDFDLWLRFFLIVRPIIVSAPIGIHRVHAASKTSLVDHKIFDEYRVSLSLRLASHPILLRKGLADVASSAARRANASMYSLDRLGCLRNMQSSILADPRVIFSPDFQKAALKLVNPLQPNKNNAP